MPPDVVDVVAAAKKDLINEYTSVIVVGDVDPARLTLHSKVAVVDRQSAFVGSFNLDPRSLYINTELGLIVESVEIDDLLGFLTELRSSQKGADNLTDPDEAAADAPLLIVDARAYMGGIAVRSKKAAQETLSAPE